MPGIEVLGRRERNVFLAYGNLLVNVWQEPLTAADIRLAFDTGKALSARYPDGMGSLTIVKEGLRLPDAESRHESTRTMSESQKWLRAMAVVLEGTGFIASAARATYSALQLAVRSQCPQKVFGEVTPACQWLATTLRLDYDPAQLEAAVASVTVTGTGDDAQARASSRWSAR